MSADTKIPLNKAEEATVDRLLWIIDTYTTHKSDTGHMAKGMLAELQRHNPVVWSNLIRALADKAQERIARKSASTSPGTCFVPPPPEQ